MLLFRFCLTSFRNMSGDEKFITRINLDELKGFVHTVESLPCFIEEAVQLGVIITNLPLFYNFSKVAILRRVFRIVGGGSKNLINWSHLNLDSDTHTQNVFGGAHRSRITNQKICVSVYKFQIVVVFWSYTKDKMKQNITWLPFELLGDLKYDFFHRVIYACDCSQLTVRQ